MPDEKGPDEKKAPEKKGPEKKAPESKGPPPRRTRPRHLVAGILLAALAFAVTVQVRQDEADSYTALRGVELVELLKSLDAANGRLNDQISDLTTVRDELESSTNASETAQEEAQRRLDELSILAGTVGATGPGIRLTIADPDDGLRAATLLDTVQELRDAGAEVIAVNGVARVVAQSWFADADDGGVLISGRLVEAPYVIEAIGKPETLLGPVNIRGGISDRVANRGGSLSAETVESITVTALADSVTPEYARADS